jgi:hypothetical protein
MFCDQSQPGRLKSPGEIIKAFRILLALSMLMEIVGHKTVYMSAYYNSKTANERGYDEFRISIERASNIRNAFKYYILPGKIVNLLLKDPARSRFQNLRLV